MLIVVAIVLLLVLSSPWNLIAFIVLVPLWVLELVGWNRTVRHKKKVVGVQTLVGRDAVVTQPCLPDGQVRVDGETWQAHCDAGASPGDRVRVSAVDGITLVVEPT